MPNRIAVDLDHDFQPGALVDFVVHQEGCSCAECMGGGHKQAGNDGSGADDIVPGDTTSTTAVPVGGYIQGAIDTSGDSDWFQINLTAGQTYTFSTILGGGLSDSILRLRNSSGTLLSENDDAIGSGSSFLFSEITFTATTTGTYFLDVTGYQSATGTFFLTSTAPVADSIAGSAQSTATMTIGAAATNGSIDANGDHDWYAVQVVAGQTYLFTTTATGGADIDTTLMLRNTSGALLAYNDDSAGTFSRIRYTATTTGTVYLDVGAWANNEAGAYRVQASIAPELQLYTNDQIATQLTTTYWGGTTRRFNVQAGGTLTVDVSALTAQGQFLAREALALWSDAIGISFSEVTTGAQITFDDDETGAFSTSTRSGSFITQSNVNVSTDWLTTSGTTLRSYSFQTYVHEIGHALGLGHGGPYNSNADYGQDAAYLNDSWVTTVMSYFDVAENTYFAGLGFSRQFTVSPMVADIVATTSLYGTATTTRTGNTTYGFNNNSGRAIYDAAIGQTATTYVVVDHGGVDTLDYSGYASAQRIDLNPEAFSNIGGSIGNMSIARGTIIENAIGGSGADILIGNAANNRLNGGAGVDQLYGGQGDDIFVVDQQGDVVFEEANAGNDLVESAGNFYLYANIEQLTLTGTGNSFGVGNDLLNVLTGNSGENLLIAGAGNDQVFGGGARDAIFGEDGDDRLNGQAGVDYIVGGAGADEIDGGIEADEIYGQDGNDTIFGGTSFDTDIMVGGAGNDTIHGNSGLGDYDRMYGNEGDDVFWVDTPDDLVFEQGNEGTDTVYADINGAGYYLYDNIENLVLWGVTPFGVGNALDNTLTGNASNNWLLGGAGNDRIIGGIGDDVLFGEAGSDTFVFAVGSGADVIGDFTRGQDRIDVSAYGYSFAQLQAAFVQDGNVGAINLGGGNLLILHNVTMSQLTASDFILTPAAEAEPKYTSEVMDGFGTFDVGANIFELAPMPFDGLQRWQPVNGEMFV